MNTSNTEQDERFKNLQKLIIDYFKDQKTSTMLKFIDSFVYHQPCNDSSVSQLIDQFLKDNDLVDSYIGYVRHIKGEDPHQYFRSISSSAMRMIEEIKTCFLNLAYHRLHDQTSAFEILQAEKEVADVQKKIDVINKQNFNILKKQLLECFECLNRNENYFYGPDEDVEKVTYFKSLNHE